MFSEDSQRIFVASSSPEVTPTAFDLAVRYLQAAEEQVNRIWSSGDHQAMLIEVHFYFIALRDVRRFLRNIVKDEAFEELCPELAELDNNWFKHYTEGRDLFEHIDDRLRGDRGGIEEIGEEGAKRRIHFGLKPSQGLFLHSDKEWDITKDTFESIKDDVEAFLRHVVDESSPAPLMGPTEGN